MWTDTKSWGINFLFKIFLIPFILLVNTFFHIFTFDKVHFFTFYWISFCYKLCYAYYQNWEKQKKNSDFYHMEKKKICWFNNLLANIFNDFLFVQVICRLRYTFPKPIEMNKFICYERKISSHELSYQTFSSYITEHLPYVVICELIFHNLIHLSTPIILWSKMM